MHSGDGQWPPIAMSSGQDSDRPLHSRSDHSAMGPACLHTSFTRFADAGCRLSTFETPGNGKQYSCTMEVTYVLCMMLTCTGHYRDALKSCNCSFLNR